jgi:N-acetylmuramoyl-L-alanine amidase
MPATTSQNGTPAAPKKRVEATPQSDLIGATPQTRTAAKPLPPRPPTQNAAPGLDNTLKRMQARVKPGGAPVINTNGSGKGAETQQAQQPDVTMQTPPVGVGEHVVRTGECVSCIAKQSGHYWESLWHDPANQELRDVRKDPNVLLVGDMVTVPPIRPKSEPGASEMRHRFVRRGEPSKLRMQVMRDHEPLANQPYELIIDDDQTRKGTTDPEGKLEVPIPGDAKRGVLWVGEEPKRYRYLVQLGAVQPNESIDGVKQRLKNLGYFAGTINRTVDDEMRTALKAFQEKNGMPVTGELDDATRQRIKEAHGC